MYYINIFISLFIEPISLHKFKTFLHKLYKIVFYMKINHNEY